MLIDINGNIILGIRTIDFVNGNTGGNIRDAIQSYTSGQQVDNITNLTQEAIRKAQ